VGLGRNAEGAFEIQESNTIDLVCTIKSLGSQLPTDFTVRFDHVHPNGTREMLDEVVLEFAAGTDSLDRRYMWTALGPGEHVLEVRVLLDGQADLANDVANVTISVRAPAETVGGVEGQDLAIIAVAAFGVVAALALVRGMVAARRGAQPPED
jgi:hypothetical protein